MNTINFMLDQRDAHLHVNQPQMICHFLRTKKDDQNRLAKGAD
jgi:hypothetical protein